MKNNTPSFMTGRELEVTITDLNHRGEGVGKADGFTLFVAGALPGEQIKAKISRLHKNYAEATLLNVEQPSEHRISPLCPYFERCGSCQLQHLTYEEQLAWKQKSVSEALRRIAGIKTEVSPILGMKTPWRYRNKAQIHLALEGGAVSAGFYEQKSHSIIDIRSCPVQHPTNIKAANALRLAVQEYIDRQSAKNKAYLPLAGASIRSSYSTENCVITLVPANLKITAKNKNQLAGLIDAKAKKAVSGIVLQQKGPQNSGFMKLSGNPYLDEQIPPYSYRISPRAFFQINPQQARVLYEQAASLAGEPSTAYDLYCGTGNFALYLSQKAKKVIGVDVDRAAIEDARTNASLNSIENALFISSKAEDIPPLLSKGEKPITIFLNPPRSGCSGTLLAAVATAKPSHIVYISCNPATLARDLGILQQHVYKTRVIQPVDMFPHTSHVETVVLLERK